MGVLYMDNLQQIMSTYNNNVEFPLLGDILVITKEQNILKEIIKKYSILAMQSLNKFKDNLAKLNNIDEFFSSVQSLFIDALQENFNEVAKDILSIGCYDYDSNEIFNECIDREYFSSFETIYNKYESCDNRIISNLSNAAAYRNVRKNSRPKWTSTTYGGTMVDAWSNQFKANTMNAFEGVGHSIRNAIGNAVDESNAKLERNNLFNNPSYREELVFSVYKCAYNLLDVLLNIINEKNLITIEIGFYNTDAQKAETMYNNLMNIDLPQLQQKEMVFSILKLNPFFSKYYAGFLRKFPDNLREFLDIAEFFYIEDVKNEIAGILYDYAKYNLGTSIEDLYNCKEKTKKRAAELNIGIEYLQLSFELISKQAETLLIEYAKNNHGTTEDDAFRCREYILKAAEKLQFDEKISLAALEIINGHISFLDKNYRTVNGIVLNTRKEADKAREDIENYSDILNNPCEFKFKYEYIEHLEKTKSLPIEPLFIERHITEINNKMAEFDKLCKKASHHEYRKTHKGFPFWNGDTNSMIFQYIIILISLITGITSLTSKDTTTGILWVLITISISLYFLVITPKKEEKIWNELTKKGKYSLNYVTSPQIIKIKQETKTNNNSAIQPNRIFCSYCGKENNISSRFCNECGKEIKK